jgi:hypothetical protein
LTAAEWLVAALSRVAATRGCGTLSENFALKIESHDTLELPFAKDLFFSLVCSTAKTLRDGTTALAYACSLGHWEDACILLDAGADPDISDRQGRNAVDAAVENSASPDLIRRMRKDKS